MTAIHCDPDIAARGCYNPDADGKGSYDAAIAALRAERLLDGRIAHAVLAAYEYGGWPFPWRHLWATGIYCGLADLPGLPPLLIYRGSRTLEDWERDVMAWGTAPPPEDPELGPVEAGFLAGMVASLDEISPLLPAEYLIAGHSLGAARALIAGGLLLCQGRAPQAIVAFGSPKPGFAPLARLLAGVPIRSYRNASPHGHDLVTDLPVGIPLILPYQHPRPLIDVYAPPAAGGGLFAFHKMELYEEALCR